MEINYKAGTIISDFNDPEIFVFDKRINMYRAPAYKYAEIKRKYPDINDNVFKDIKLDISSEISLRPYQKNLLNSGGKIIILEQ